MNAIEQHLEDLFRGLPETEEVKCIKHDIYLKAEARYKELMERGKPESEALGTVIIEMGERDDLLKRFGYQQPSALEERSLATNTLDEVNHFLTSYNQEANNIGLGIIMILLGVGLVATLDTLHVALLGVILLLVLVAGAVGLFIVAGLKLESLEKAMPSGDFLSYLPEKDYTLIEEEYSLFKERERWRVPLGVMLCIVSAVPLLLFEFLGRELLVERYGVLSLMLLVGMGVYQFVKYGMKQTAYEKVLSIGEYSTEERQFQQKIEPVSEAYWLIVTLIYLAWSFILSAWYISWIIWPIAGVAWGLITLVLKRFNQR